MLLTTPAPTLTPAALHRACVAIRSEHPLPDASAEAVFLSTPEVLDGLICLLCERGENGPVLRSLALLRYDFGCALDQVEGRPREGQFHLFL